MKAKLAGLVILVAAVIAGTATAAPYYFSRCVTGPLPEDTGYVLPELCRVHDYDQDGDVDLLDFAEYQIDPLWG